MPTIVFTHQSNACFHRWSSSLSFGSLCWSVVFWFVIAPELHVAPELHDHLRDKVFSMIFFLFHMIITIKLYRLWLGLQAGGSEESSAFRS